MGACVSIGQWVCCAVVQSVHKEGGGEGRGRGRGTGFPHYFGPSSAHSLAHSLPVYLSLIVGL